LGIRPVRYYRKVPNAIVDSRQEKAGLKKQATKFIVSLIGLCHAVFR